MCKKMKYEKIAICERSIYILLYSDGPKKKTITSKWC